MQVNQSVTVAKPPREVWVFLSDVGAVAECIPGLELIDEGEGGKYRARFAVKVGPLSAKLDGEGVLTRDDDELSASVEGKGVDKRGGSRASGVMRYKVMASGDGSVIDVVADVTLSGPLAQVGRTGIIEDVAQSLTRQFAENLEKRFAGSPEGSPEAVALAAPDTNGKEDQPEASVQEPAHQKEPHHDADQFDAGQALWWAIWRRVTGAFKRLFGGSG